jgi:DNA-binding CsgD family transcriptional regulator
MLVLERLPKPPSPAAAHAAKSGPGAAGMANGLAAALMDQIECGLLACDGQGRLLHANRAALRELDSARALMLVGRALHCPGELQAEFAAALHDAAHRQRSRLLWVGQGEQQLMVVATPVRGEDVGIPAALLMMGRRNLCSPLGLEMLALQHGLTLAERRVLRALIANHSARQIASDHGVAVSTVRTQIMSIRAKVGVRNIDALLLRAAQVPPVSSLHGCWGEG